MSGLGNGLVNLFKGWGRGIGKAADNFLLGADARKAISDEVGKKFQHKIDFAHTVGSKKAKNIKDLGDKITQSKEELADARKAWQDKYDSALAGAKNQRQTDIDNYNTQLKTYQDALADANAGKQSILNQLYDSEAKYDPSRTLFTDVTTGNRYIINPITGEYENLAKTYAGLNPKQQQKLVKLVQGFDNRLLDTSTGTPKVINAFDDATLKAYRNQNHIFDNYYSHKISTQNAALRDAENEINRANDNLSNWSKTNNRPADWDDINDPKSFRKTYEKANGSLPKEYSFNGKTYRKEKDLDNAYKAALDYEQNRKDLADKVASGYVSKRDAEIAQRIQDAKDIKKAKLVLGGALGAGALYAGAKAMYGGDDTPDNTDNIDNTDNTYTGEPDHDFNVNKEGQAILDDRQQQQQQIDTGFDPDKAEAAAEAAAVIASAAYGKGAEDGNSVKASDDLGNIIGATTGGHTMDDRLYKLIKAMQDPYKADAVANYIYSRHGDDPEVQRLGWRGWLNKYYGDSLRTKMNIDPSGYKGMHISGGL